PRRAPRGPTPSPSTTLFRSWSWLIPEASGTSSSPGPEENRTVTFAPASTVVPVLGFHFTASPSGTSPLVTGSPTTSCDVPEGEADRKSTRLNSSHVSISYAV